MWPRNTTKDAAVLMKRLRYEEAYFQLLGPSGAGRRFNHSPHPQWCTLMYLLSFPIYMNLKKDAIYAWHKVVWSTLDKKWTCCYEPAANLQSVPPSTTMWKCSNFTQVSSSYCSLAQRPLTCCPWQPLTLFLELAKVYGAKWGFCPAVLPPHWCAHWRSDWPCRCLNKLLSGCHYNIRILTTWLKVSCE